jgi:hypothetical protein
MAVDIVINETIDSVDITVNPNIIEVNVTKTSGGGGSQTLAQTLDLGNQTGGENILINNADAIELENTSLLQKGTYNFGGNGGISRICSNQYEDMWQNGFRHVFDQSGFIRNSTNCFDIVPDSSFDVTLRFAVGSFWTLDDGTTYVCTDATEGAAVWELYATNVPTLQQVTDEGATTTNDITVGDALAGKRTELRDLGVVFYDEDLYPGEDAGGVTVGQFIIRDVQTNNDSQISGVVDSINNLIGIDFRKIGKSVRVILPTNLIGTMTQLILPSKTNGNYTLATLDDIPTKTSDITNDGSDGVNPFITALDIPTTGQASTLVREVKNMTGATLTKGTVVFISGANGNKALVSKAIATTDALSARTFGLLQSNILNNGTGNCVIIGDLSGLDTSSFAEGAQLYLSGVTAGTYTSTRTLAPTHLVYVGKVTRSHPTQGQIEVQIQNGYELEEIHDCQIISPTNNQALIYETSTDLWKNKTIIEDSITNAVTDKAPSQNAVFDALALKQDSLGYTPVKTVVKDTAVSSTVTGTTTETILKSYTIAGGTFASNDVINLVSARFTKTGTAGNVSTFKMYINTTNSLSGATQIGQLSGTGLYYKFSRTFALRGGSLLGFAFTANGTQAGSDMGNTSVTQSTTTLNPANTFYIIFSGTNAVSTDSIFSSEIYITN